MTTTAIRLHLIVVDDGGSGQQGWVLIQVQAMIERLVSEVFVAAAVASVQILLDVELLRHEVGQVFRFDVPHVQHRLVVRNELGFDEGAIGGVQLVVQWGHQILHADYLFDLVPIPVQIQPSRLEDLLR